MAVRRASRSRFVLLLLVLTAGTIITLSYRSKANHAIDRVKSWASDVFKPVETGFRDAWDPVANFFRGTVDYGSEKSANAKLRQEVGRLRRQNLERSDQARQLQALLALDKLPFADGLPKVTAEVINTNFSNFQLTLQLNRGRSEGVTVGMPVVSGAGLVGRVVQVASGQATVLLVTDPSSSVGVRDGGVVGVASGQGQGKTLRVDYVPPGQPIHKGDVMVTSGLQGGLYPAGIPLGTVSIAAQPPDSLQEELALRPVVDLSQVQFVDVLQWKPPPS
ncbi:MAG TPA: rod shape-determining protein MreC [Acidimicrobiales bacterium]|nr:rod shape-determining protein MreC [Acidimicrobiales bacterium]